jgi:hypothetical protein
MNVKITKGIILWVEKDAANTTLYIPIPPMFIISTFQNPLQIRHIVPASTDPTKLDENFFHKFKRREL